MKFIIAIVLFIVGGCLIYFMGWPQYQKIDDLKTNREEFDAALFKVKTLTDTITIKQQAFEEISTEDRFYLDRIVRTDQEPLRLLIDLQELASQNGIDPESLTVSGFEAVNEVPAEEQTPVTKDLVAVPSSISFTGSYNDLLVFLQVIEQNLEIADITNLGFNIDPDTGQNVYELTFQTYALI